jgi:hypothetical protein
VRFGSLSDTYPATDGSGFHTPTSSSPSIEPVIARLDHP